jgi:hypothetical protein
MFSTQSEIPQTCTTRPPCEETRALLGRHKSRDGYQHWLHFEARRDCCRQFAWYEAPRAWPNSVDRIVRLGLHFVIVWIRRPGVP